MQRASGTSFRGVPFSSAIRPPRKKSAFSSFDASPNPIRFTTSFSSGISEESMLRWSRRIRQTSEIPNGLRTYSAAPALCTAWFR